MKLTDLYRQKDADSLVLSGTQTLSLNAGTNANATVEENVTHATAPGQNVVNSDDLEMGYFVLSGTQLSPKCGVRFDNVTVNGFSSTPEIGKVGEIVSVKVQFQAKQTNSGGTCVVPIYGIDEDNTAVFSTTDSDFSSRARTTATLEWDLSSTAWTAGDKGAGQLTPDLSSLLQEILSRPGWSSGNAIAFSFDYKTGNTTFRNAASTTHSTYDTPEIVIEYKVWENQRTHAVLPIFEYMFDGNILEGTGNHQGALTGTLGFVSGQKGLAADFTGTQYLQMSASADFSTNNFTVAFWIKASSFPAGWQTIFEFDRVGTGWYGAFLSATIAGGMHLRWGNNSTTQTMDAATAMTTNTWHHWVLTVNGTNAKMFLNGSLDASETGVTLGTPPGTPEGIRLGAHNGGNEYVTAEIDHFQYWNTGKTDAECLEIYNDAQ